MRARRPLPAVLAVLLAVSVVLVATGSTAGAATDPCTGLKTTQVASAFAVSKIDTVTRGKQDFADSCFFSARLPPTPCVSQLTAFITTDRFKSRDAAAAAFADLSSGGQSLPPGDPPEGLGVAVETVPGIGDGAYYTNRRGGTLVALDGRLIRAFGGGFLLPGTAVGCDVDAVRSANREALTRLATKVARPRPSPAPSGAAASGLIDVCALVTPAEASAALGGTYSDGTTPKSVAEWKPDKVVTGYGLCQVPMTSTDELLHVQVWRYATAAAAMRAFRQSRDGAAKDGAPVQAVAGVGDGATFVPAHAANGAGVVSPRLDVVAGPVVLQLQDARGDHTSPDGRTVADQTGESQRLAQLATTALSRLPSSG